jgi:hypothetical protein
MFDMTACAFVHGSTDSVKGVTHSDGFAVFGSICRGGVALSRRMGKLTKQISHFP